MPIYRGQTSISRLVHNKWISIRTCMYSQGVSATIHRRLKQILEHS